MAVELVTGYSGTEHVSSSDDGARQAGTVGTGMYVLETVEDPLAATLENANTVTVGPGDVLINGRHVRLTGSTTYAVPVGTQAMQTSNLLVLRYSVSDDGTEKVEAVTLTGEPAASDPADPALATGSILDGDSPVDMPLYRVVTTGIESAQPVRLFETVPPISALPGVGDNVLDVAHGGTGITSNPSMLTNLGSTSAAGVFQKSPRPGITGTLPVSHGGTGATSAAAARSSLGALRVEFNGLSGNYNDYMEAGVYSVLGTANTPISSGNWATLIVNRVNNNSGYVTQFLLPLNTDLMFYRSMNRGTWSKWYQFISTTVYSGSFTGGSWRRRGAVVSVVINTTTNVPEAWSDVKLGTIPTGSRPSTPVIFPVLVENLGTSIRGIVNPDGSVHLTGVGGTPAGSNGKYGSCAFVV